MSRPAFPILLAIGLLAGGCASGTSDSSSSNEPTATTAAPSVETSAVVPPTSAPTTTTSTAEGSTSTLTQEAAQPALAISVYWTRAYGRPDAIDTAVYHDTGDARPYVLYGSVTNTGSVAVHSPWVSAVWPSATERGAVVDPSGAPLSVLAPGASADFLIVVDDPAVGPQLADSTPTFQGMGQT